MSICITTSAPVATFMAVMNTTLVTTRAGYLFIFSILVLATAIGAPITTGTIAFMARGLVGGVLGIFRLGRVVIGSRIEESLDVYS